MPEASLHKFDNTQLLLYRDYFELKQLIHNGQKIYSDVSENLFNLNNGRRNYLLIGSIK